MSSALGSVAGHVSHVAHFYEQADTHVGHVAEYLADALSADVNVLIVARSSMAEQIRSAVAARGVDVAAAIRSGSIVELDAEVLLARMQQRAGLDLETFEGLVRTALHDAAHGGEVRVYGELVSLLWEAGDVQGAIDVEDRWNRLSEDFSFSLMCGYRSTSLSSGHIDGFHDLCGRHSGVVGAPPDISGAERARRFPGSRQALRSARRFVTETLSGWGRGELIDDATLVVAELATNAVMHAQSDFTVALTRTPEAVRVSVSDVSDVLPRSPERTVDTIGGHGMHVVRALATATGHDLVAGGKVIWAELGHAASAPSTT